MGNLSYGGKFQGTKGMEVLVSPAGGEFDSEFASRSHCITWLFKALIGEQIPLKLVMIFMTFGGS